MITPATIAPEKPPTIDSVAATRRNRHTAAIWLRWIFLLILAIVAVDYVGSWVVQHSRVRRVLDARLASAFGRPVEVGVYSFSLWDGAALQASPVTVAEDPRFGHEYFLRADALAIRLRWLSLLSGRLELGSLSLSQPSLNLVRAADGRWNVEEWLPAPAGGTASPPNFAQRAAPRIKEIEVDSGRVNFKRGDEKLPFAFVDVAGSLRQDAPGHWQVNLDASPARAAVVLQQAGTLHVDGQLGGTSSRLRPADLHVRWQDAALADAFRLGTGTDHGVRGVFSIGLDARAQGPQWDLQGHAELRRVHRWDLSIRADNPAVNVQVRANWFPEDSRLDFSNFTIVAPRSSVQGSGVVTWAETAVEADHHLIVSSDGIDCADLLAWVRAFHPGLSEALTAHGTFRFSTALSGWPLRPASGAASTEGVSLEGGSLRVPLKLARSSLNVDGATAHLLPAAISIGSDDGSLRVEGTMPVTSLADSTWKLTGRAANVADLTDVASAFGWSGMGNWKIEGPAAFDLSWRGREKPPWTHATGKVDLEGLALRAPFLNRSASQIRGRWDFAHGSSELTVNSAFAFGGDWKGTIDLFPATGGTHFSFSVDRLNSEDLDRWLNPRWREGFLGNILPFLNSSPASEPAPLAINAQGRIAIDQFAFLRYVAHGLKGTLSIRGRRIELDDAETDFYGAHVSGKLSADLQKIPAYAIKAHVSDLNLNSLMAGSATLSKAFSGRASGDLALSLSGVGRDSLLGSLECSGSADIQDASLQGYDLVESIRTKQRAPGKTAFSRAIGTFKCGNNGIQITQLRLLGPDAALAVSGAVDAARNLDMRVRWVNGGREDADSEDADTHRLFQVDGPLLAPTVTPAGTTPKE